MVNVLFVCLGNICRSPMAEAIFKDLITINSLENNIACDSVGIENYHVGQSPDTRTIVTLEAHGINTYKHKARKLTLGDVKAFDYIIVMEETVYDEVHFLLNGGQHSGLHYLGEFDPLKKGKSIKDPYYGSIKDFEDVYETISRCCKKLIDTIKKARL